jgi:ribonuclease P protein component
MNTAGETFGKRERLCSNKLIKSLFEKGNVLYCSSMKIVWDKPSSLLPSPAQVAFSVSKKGFRHAVTRNLVKRRMRETYRKNKHILYNYLDKEQLQIVFVIILRGNDIPDYFSLEKTMKDLLKKLIIQINAKEKEC